MCVQLQARLYDDCEADDELHLEEKQPYLSFQTIHLLTIDAPQSFVPSLFSA
jgi:hypothetical protein